jgi:hypothetical protein
MYDSRWHESTIPVKEAIDRAFAKLNEQGVTCRANFWCCQTCGCAGMEEAGAKAYCFYHEQDFDALKEGRGLHLAFGDLSDEATDDDYAAVGQKVVAALKKEPGLKITWDGSAGKRIHVAAS